MLTFLKRLFGINRRFRTRSHTRKAGPFSVTVTATTELSTIRQMDFLRRLGYDGDDLSKIQATLLITRILRPVDYAISHTFKKSTELSKENLRALQIAIAHSPYITSFPRYGPNSTWEELAAVGDPYAPLTKDQRIAVTDTAFRTLPHESFLSLPSNGVKKYKDTLDARLTQRV